MTKLLLASALSLLFVSASARSDNSSDEGSCSLGTPYFNATGSISLNVTGQDDPWQLSVAVTDIRDSNLTRRNEPTEQIVRMFLGVPTDFFGSEKGNETRVCAYVSSGENYTSTGDGSSEESCNGVFKAKCIKEYMEAPLPQTGTDCPPLNLSDDCKGVFGGFTTNPFNFSNAPCESNVPPNIWDDYGTRGALPGIVDRSDSSVDSFTAYDLRVNQSNPILLTTWNGETGNAMVVCLAANNIEDGSRVPEADFPPSAAISLRASGSAMLMAGVVGLTMIVNGII